MDEMAFCNKFKDMGRMKTHIELSLRFMGVNVLMWVVSVFLSPI